MKEILISLILSVVFVSGCTQTESLMGWSPNVEAEATVVSLTSDKSAIIRIDKLGEMDNSYSSYWASLGVEEGKEIEVGFEYTTKPAKYRTVPYDNEVANNQNGYVSHQVVPLEITHEGEYIVFTRKSSSATKVTETVLPGLKEGSRFKTTLWDRLNEVSDIKIYELIS